MENASKALIIAGAILLSILIISLGIIVYNQAKGTVGSVNLTEHEIATFNQKFETYEGNNVSGTTVNNLLQAVVGSNTAAIRDNTGSFVTVKFPTLSRTGNDNYLTMGVDVSSGSPVVEYSHANFSGAMDTIGAGELVTDLANPYDGAGGNATTCNIKVQPGQTYIVTMAKNASSGLIDRILVVRR